MRYLPFFALIFGAFCLYTPLHAAPTQDQVLSGNVLLKEKSTPDFRALLQQLKGTWKVKADSATISDKTLVFNTPDATVMVAYLDYAVPEADLRAVATMNWQWKTAAQEAVAHRAQMVVSVVGNPSRTLSLQQQLTKIVGAILEKTPSAAVYVESQYLLLSRDFYLGAAQNMLREDSLPLACWVYIGLMGEASGNNGYTYGLSEFGLPELEVVNNKKPLSEVHTVLYDAAQTLLKYRNTPASDGQYTTLEGYEIGIKRSKAKFLEGETLKLEF
jgi:hypothetical protein